MLIGFGMLFKYPNRTIRTKYLLNYLLELFKKDQTEFNVKQEELKCYACICIVLTTKEQALWKHANWIYSREVLATHSDDPISYSFLFH